METCYNCGKPAKKAFGVAGIHYAICERARCRHFVIDCAYRDANELRTV